MTNFFRNSSKKFKKVKSAYLAFSKMDYNNYMLSTQLFIGRYDTKTVHINKTQLVLNRICGIINLVCGLKTIAILLISDHKAIFYLIELYIVEGLVQNSFHFGMSFLHIATSIAYFYWRYLNYNTRQMKCLDFLFTPDINDLCKNYDIKLEATKLFIKQANFIKSLIYILIWAIEGFFLLFIVRCLSVAYLEIPSNHFFFISIPLSVVTYFSFHCLTLGILSCYTLLFVTQRFLVMRSRTISDRLLKLTKRTKKLNETNFMSKKLRKSKNSWEIPIAINNIVLQFKQANQIFDNLLSIIYVNVLICGITYPAFVFFDFSIIIKVLSIFMVSVSFLLKKQALNFFAQKYFAGVFIVGFGLTVNNDIFIYNVRSTIFQ